MPTPEEMREAVARYVEEIHRSCDESDGPPAEPAQPAGPPAEAS